MDYKSLIKSQDTEEWFDLVFTRPLGWLWVRFFNHFGVHPNTVTVLSMILGAVAGWMFHYDADTLQGFIYNLVGVLLLMWANIYDGVDGQLARLTGKKTELGRILDGAAGDLWFFVIYFSLAWRLTNHTIPFTQETWGLLAWFTCAFCGLCCHSPQSRLADYYRNIHLFFLLGSHGSELDTAQRQRKKYETLSWRNDFIAKLFQWFYKRYTAAQEQETPSFQSLMQRLREVYGADIPQSFRLEFRRLSLPLMKYTNILTFNTRAFILYVSVLTDKPWIYLLAEATVFTAIYVYMRSRHEAFCRQLSDRLSEHPQDSK